MRKTVDRRAGGRCDVTGRVESLALIIALAALLTSAPGAGAAEGTQGFFIVVEGHRSHIGADDPPAAPPPNAVYVDKVGGGGALHLGYGITPTFALRLVMAGSQHETSRDDIEVRLTSATLEAVHHFQPGRPLRPFVFGGLGGFSIESQDDVFDYKTEGGGLSFGAGLDYFVGPDFAVTFGVRGEAINWDRTTATLTLPDGSRVTAERPIEDSGGAIKLSIGVGYWF